MVGGIIVSYVSDKTNRFFMARTVARAALVAISPMACSTLRDTIDCIVVICKSVSGALDSSTCDDVEGVFAFVAACC